MTSTAAALVERLTEVVPDFPKPGILFRDLTPVFGDGEALRAVADALIEPYRGRIDAIAGVEARGFLLAAAGHAAGHRARRKSTVQLVRSPATTSSRRSRAPCSGWTTPTSAMPFSTSG